VSDMIAKALFVAFNTPPKGIAMRSPTTSGDVQLQWNDSVGSAMGPSELRRAPPETSVTTPFACFPACAELPAPASRG
jgi:hypothetical protein